MKKFYSTLSNYLSLLFVIAFIAIAEFIVTVAPAQQMATCPVPGSNCNPNFKYTSVLPDTAYYNCFKSKILDPQLDKTGNILYTWTSPDGSTAAGTTFTAIVEGTYILCYDTAGANGGCPKSDTVHVVKYSKRFANAGPDLNICSKQQAVVGIVNSRPSLIYKWIPSTVLVKSDVDKSNPKVYYENKGITVFSSKILLTVTDTLSGCKDSDTVLVKVSPMPMLRIDRIKPYFCTQESVEIDLIAYNPVLRPSISNLTINTSDFILPEPIDTMVVFANFPSAAYSALKYSISLKPSGPGDLNFHFSDTSSIGCGTSIDSVIHVLSPGPNAGDSCNTVTASMSASIGLSVHAYPNPFADALEISVENQKQNNFKIEIADSRGIIVLSENISAASATINASLLTPGMYSLNIISGQQSSYQKVVKLP